MARVGDNSWIVETCSKPYDDLIRRLENIIYNWHDHDELIKHLAWSSQGICDNIDNVLGEVLCWEKK